MWKVDHSPDKIYIDRSGTPIHTWPTLNRIPVSPSSQLPPSPLLTISRLQPPQPASPCPLPTKLVPTAQTYMTEILTRLGHPRSPLLLSRFSFPRSFSIPKKESVVSTTWNVSKLGSPYICTSLDHLLRLNTLGYRIGTRVLELMVWRTEGSSKAPKREIKLLSVLMMIHTQVWKAVFGKPADAIERSVENPDECAQCSIQPLAVF